ncbi:MAG: chitobiase/beta-hexosaminidase C-terminal domain-containing protein [Puniceicoccales bacterium]|jgi:alpha-tubulin suppressor-like RCC1 family protein|nr:chitobiase/beta-hexosaminidase C-terminal domain-containing protein [Puniceicoccales bacterium]
MSIFTTHINRRHFCSKTFLAPRAATASAVRFVLLFLLALIAPALAAALAPFAAPTARAAEVSAARTVSVLVVYTAAAKNAAGGTDGIKAKINAMVSDTNTAFVNSDIDAKVVLAAAQEVAYTESAAKTNSYSRDLEALGGGLISGVAALRESTSADLVVLLRAGAGTTQAGTTGVAGLSYLLVDGYIRAGTASESIAFSVVGLDLNRYTFTHELGHSFGCGHEIGNDDSTGLRDYSHGYIYTASGVERGTVMAYHNNPTLRFSNPRYSEGTPLVATGNAATADNARTINETVESVAAYRDASRRADAPVFTTNIQPDAAGFYWDTVTVTLATATSNATIYYTIGDSVLPLRYSRALTVSSAGETVIRAHATRAGYTQSEESEIRLKLPPVADAKLTVNTSIDYSRITGGKYVFDGPVELSFVADNAAAVIRYTLDGTAVTETSPVYSAPFSLTANTTLRIRLYQQGCRPGAEIVYNFVVNALETEQPVFSPSGGIYANGVTVGVTSETLNAIIAYSTDGVRYYTRNSGEISLDITASLTLRAYAYQSASLLSETVSAAYTILSNTEVFSRFGAKVAASGNNTLLVDANGKLYAAGDNSAGRLGDAAVETQTALVQIAANVATVAAGAGHTLYTTASNKLYAAGDNTSGQLGLGDNAGRAAFALVADGALLAATGDAHSLFTTTTNELYVFGDNRRGQLGLGADAPVSANKPVLLGANVLLVAAGASHSLFVTGDGVLFAAGANESGQLGDGTAEDKAAPVAVAADVAAVAAAGAHTIFLKNDGTAWAMGGNEYAQLGDGTAASRLSPVQIASDVKAIAAGPTHTLLLKNDGTVWGAGLNNYGQLGAGQGGGTFAKIALPADALAQSVAAGLAHSIVRLESGSSLVFGRNDFGQLGIGSSENSTAPVAPAQQLNRPVLTFAPAADGAQQVVTLAAGSFGTVALPQKIRYTLDDNAVTETSPVYAAPFDAAPGTVIRARAYATAIYLPSEEVVTVVPVPLPVITAQPASRSARIGESIEFSVAAANATAFQWFRNGVAISGATRATLALTVAGGDNGAVFYAKVSNAGGAVQSESASLAVVFRATVAATPVAVTSPISAPKSALDNALDALRGNTSPLPEVAVGGHVTYSANADGDELVYQWKRNGEALAGETGASLTVSAEDAAAGVFSVEITDASGGVTVRSAPVFRLVPAPEITVQPAAFSTARRGGRVTLRVAADDKGAGRLWYQWYKDGEPLYVAVFPTLEIAVADVADAGIYTVIVTNRVGAAVESAPAELTFEEL